MLLYSQDNNGVLPMNNYPASNPTSWYRKVDPYVGLDYVKVWANPDAYRSTIYFCPSQKPILPDASWARVHYAVNKELDYSLYGDAAFINVGDLIRPAEYCLASDSLASDVLYNDRADKLIDWNHLNARHGGRPNFLYGDQHVGSFAKAIYGFIDAPAAETDFYTRLWQARAP